MPSSKPKNHQKSNKKRKNNNNHNHNHHQNFKKTKLTNTLNNSFNSHGNYGHGHGHNNHNRPNPTKSLPKTYGVDADIYFEIKSEDSGKCIIVQLHKQVLEQKFDYFRAMFDPTSNWYINGEPKKLHEMRLQSNEFIEEYFKSCYENYSGSFGIVKPHRNVSHSNSKKRKLENDSSSSSKKPKTEKEVQNQKSKDSTSSILSHPKNKHIKAYFHYYDTYFQRKEPIIKNPDTEITINKDNFFTIFRFVQSKREACFEFFKDHANELNYGNTAIPINNVDKCRNVTNFLKLPLNLFYELNNVCQPVMTKSDWKDALNQKKMALLSEKIKLVRKKKKEKREIQEIEALRRENERVPEGDPDRIPDDQLVQIIRNIRGLNEDLMNRIDRLAGVPDRQRNAAAANQNQNQNNRNNQVANANANSNNKANKKDQKTSKSPKAPEIPKFIYRTVLDKFSDQESSTYLFRTAKSMFSTIFGSKIEYVPLSNRKIDVLDDFWVKNRVRTSFEPQNRCFRGFSGIGNFNKTMKVKK